MIWRKRHHSPPSAPDRTRDAVPSEETRRARAAAREAAIQLDEVRAQRAGVERASRELDDLNRHNGFYGLVRQALGS